jgi:hypothetical protein
MQFQKINFSKSSFTYKNRQFEFIIVYKRLRVQKIHGVKKEKKSYQRNKKYMYIAPLSDV